MRIVKELICWLLILLVIRGGGIYYYVFVEDEDLYFCIFNIIKFRNNKYELWYRFELEKWKLKCCL